MNQQLVNVLLLGAAFHLIFFSFQTSVFIQQTVVNSLKSRPDSKFTGDGYISLCITYVVFALSNWLAPSMIALTGLRMGMFFGALTYALYSASFIQPTTWLFYSAAALIGLGAGPLWTAQGSYLAKNSDLQTSGRNAALFWSMLQSSILFGNIFVYLMFSSQTTISDQTRYIVYGVLTCVCSLGILLLLSLRDQPTEQQEVLPGEGARTLPVSVTALEQFVGAVNLSKSANMILLSFAFLFTGQLLCFFTGVYGTAVGATSQFGPDAKKFVGLSGVFIGIGEIVGGSIFGLMGAKFSKTLGRDTIFLFGYLTLVVAIALVFVNLPADASLATISKTASIIEPRIWIAMLCSSLIGFADACFNTQIYSTLMSRYTGSESVGAFALFKFMQSVGSAIAFLYSTALNLHHQLYLIAVIGTMATLAFCWLESRGRSKMGLTSMEKSESKQSIVRSQSGLALPENQSSTNADGLGDKVQSWRATNQQM